MPNKTIYVADNDLAVFDRAQELAGENLSATIAQALRHFIATEEAREQGFGEITLKVGQPMTYTYKRFLGRKLARRRDRDPETGRVVTQTVFQTAKGRFVLATRVAPDWSDWSDWRDWSDWASSFDFNFDWDKDWNLRWSWGADANPEERTQARQEAKQAREQAKQAREEWRRRKREAQEAQRAAKGRGDWPGRPDRPDHPDWSGGDYTMEVYDTLDDLKPHISEEFFAQVDRALRGDEVEFLDI